MKKLLLTTALAAFLMKSCNRDRHDYEYIPEPPIEEPVCPPDCDCPECYTPEPPVCPPDCDCPECYDNGGGEPPVEPDPCAEFEENFNVAKQDSINAADAFRDALTPAITEPNNIENIWWEHFNIFGVADDFADSVLFHNIVIRVFIRNSGQLSQNPYVYGNLANIYKLFDRTEKFIEVKDNIAIYKHKLYECRLQNPSQTNTGKTR